MRNRISTHIRANVVGYVAVFLALSGTAAALPGHDTVFSDDIVAGGVRASDVAAGAVGGRALHDGSVGGTDVRDASLGSADVRNGTLRGVDVGDETLGSPDVAGLTGADIADNSVASADIQENSLGGDDIAPDSLTGQQHIVDNSVGSPDVSGLTGVDIIESSLHIDTRFRRHSDDEECIPGSAVFVECLTTTPFGFASPQSVLVLVTGGWLGSAQVGHQDTGRCKLTRDGADSPASGFSNVTTMGQNGDSHDQGVRAARLSLIGIDTAVPPGSHTWSVECTEDSGQMQYFDLAIAAVELGPS
ncbi:MAG: hypothetical protein GEU88_08740 [Solirubrobacterales bacterium]|nr:hypothetical protein [Solirubrobacterales bacterium]